MAKSGKASASSWPRAAAQPISGGSAPGTAEDVGCGRTAGGEVRPLPPRVLGTFEVMQAAQTARIASKRSDHADRLCTRVAAALHDDAALATEFVAVEVRTDRYDIVSYWQTGRPLDGTLHASCPVAGGAT